MSWYPVGGSWYSGGLSRSIARLSPDRDVELMSKLVLWTTPFSKKIVLDVQNYSVELKQLGRVERQELYPDIVPSQGMSSPSVPKQGGISFVGMLSYKSLIWIGLSSNQTQANLLNVLVWPILMPVHATYESTVLEYLDKFVLSPSTTFLSSPCLRRFILNIGREHWKLVGTNFVSSQGMRSGS